MPTTAALTVTLMPKRALYFLFECEVEDVGRLSSERSI